MFGSEGDLEICELAGREDAEQAQEGMDRRRQPQDWTKATLEEWRAGCEPIPLAYPLRGGLAENGTETFPVRKLQLRLSRRQLGVGAAASLSVGLLGVSFRNAGQITDVIFGPDLMRSGPLGEEALGEEQAPHTMIEYATLTCPHCDNFFEEAFPALKATYINTGRLRFILREFPFDRLSLAVAVLARHAEPGRYFPLVQALLRRRDEWMVDKPIEPLFAIASEFGFTRDRFIKAFSDQRVFDGVDWVRLRAAEKFKVNATPTFFIDGRMHKGNMSFERIEQALTSSGDKPNGEI